MNLKDKTKSVHWAVLQIFYLTINESIPQLHDQGIEVENISEEVLQLMAEIKRWITETKQPYPSLEEDPFFYLLLTEKISRHCKMPNENTRTFAKFFWQAKKRNQIWGKTKAFS